MNNKKENLPPHPVHVDGAPILQRKHGGCSNAEQNPHDSCDHHQELHAVTRVQVTEHSFRSRRLTECESVCLRERESLSSSD